MLGIPACFRGEDTIFGIYHKEALCSLFPHATMPRMRFSVYTVKNASARRSCMHQWRGDGFRVYIIRKLCGRRFCMHLWREHDFRYMLYNRRSQLALAACNNVNNTIFGIYYKDATRSPFQHPSMARTSFSVYIIKKLCAHCCCMHQWRGHDFWYVS